MNDKKDIKQGLNKLLEEFIESKIGGRTKSEEYLRENNIDPASVAKEGMRRIKRKLFLLKAEQEENERNKLLEDAILKIKQAYNKGMNMTGQKLQSYVLKVAPNVHFRSLENWSDDEIKEVLKDVDLIKLIEDLKANRDSE